MDIGKGRAAGGWEGRGNKKWEEPLFTYLSAVYIHVGSSQSEWGSEDTQPAALPFPTLLSCVYFAGPKGDHVKFPIDFFEHCVPLTSGDVEVSVRQGSCPQCCCILAVVMLSISRSTIDCN